MKKLVYLLLLPIVLVAGALALLPTAVSTEYFARTLSEKLSDELGRKISFKSAELELGQTLALKLEDVSVANPPWASEKEFISIKQLESTIPLKRLLEGNIHFTSLRAKKARVSLETAEDGSASWEKWGKGSSTKASPDNDQESSLIPEADDVVIEDLVVGVKGPKSESSEVIDIGKLALHDVGLSRRGKHSLSLNYREQPLDIKLNHGVVRQLISKQKTEIEGSVKSGEHLVKLSGMIRLIESGVAFKLAVSGSGPSLGEFERHAQANLPRDKPYSFGGDVAFDGSKLTVDSLELKIADSNVTGAVEVDFSTRPLSLMADLDSNVLRVADLLPPPDERSERGDEVAEEISSSDLPYELLKLVDGNVKLRAKKLFAPHEVLLADANVNAVLKDGVLELAPLSASALEGEMKVSARISENSLKVDAEGKGVSIAALRKFVGIRGVTEGIGNLSAELSATGKNPDELLKTLNGTIQVSSPGGKLEDSSVKVLSSGLHEIFGPLFGQKEEVKIDCMVLKAQVENGDFKIGDYVARLGKLDVFGKGNLDAVKKRFAFNFYTRSSMPSLSSLIPPFRVFGDVGGSITALPNPVAVAADLSDTTEGLARGALGTLGDGVSTVAQAAFQQEQKKAKKLQGVELCEDIIERDKRTLSSTVGSTFK